MSTGVQRPIMKVERVSLEGVGFCESLQVKLKILKLQLTASDELPLMNLGCIR